MRLTINEIKTVNTKVLNVRFCELMEKGETLPAAEITAAEARETLRIEEELHERLLKGLGCDPYPPDRIEEEPPSNYMISLLKSRGKSPPRATEIIHPCSAGVTKKVEAEMQTEGNLRFKVVITSSIGHKVAEQNVKADSKEDAGVKALNIIKELGLKKAKYKIS